MIRIGIGGNILTPDQLRAIGWTLIDSANAQDRYAVQLAQSQAKPGDARERAQADRAASVAIRHASKLREILQGLRA